MNDTQQQALFKVLLIGDYCIDQYHYGVVERISPEAPVPVLKITRTFSKPGMAGNVKQNLNVLGVNVDFVFDKESTRTRLIDEKSNQHIARADVDVTSQPITFQKDKQAQNNLEQYDAILISDYCKGTVDYELVPFLAHNFKGPIFVDTKKPLLHNFDFPNVYVKINSDEYNKSKTMCSNLIVTYDRGALFKTKWFNGYPVEVNDVTGAGDTFFASFAYAFLYLPTYEDSDRVSLAVKFALKASSITVQHTGVYAPTLEEINGNN